MFSHGTSKENQAIRKWSNAGEDVAKIQDGVQIVVLVLLLKSRRFPLVKQAKAWDKHNHKKKKISFFCACVYA